MILTTREIMLITHALTSYSKGLQQLRRAGTIDDKIIEEQLKTIENIAYKLSEAQDALLERGKNEIDQ